MLPSLPNESSQQYQQRLKERRDEVNRLQQHAETLEKQLAQEIPELQLNQENVNRQVIADQLPEGSALVEFVRFKRYDFDAPKGEKWQEDRYLAFVVMAPSTGTGETCRFGRSGTSRYPHHQVSQLCCQSSR